MNPAVDAYIARSTKWPAEMAALRPVLLAAGLSEAIKWGKPCFADDRHNIAIMQEMNDFLSLMFFKGALLADPDGVLVDQGPNSRSAKRIEFTSVEEVLALADTVSAYVREAVAVEHAGLALPAAAEPEWCPELVERLADDDEFRAAFEALTPGRRREYHLHIAEAKQSETRRRRIDKHAERILAGKGMRD
jgi:uncharacterized protein YdeI (YjbR/CyaY-like superfamily)